MPPAEPFYYLQVVDRDGKPITSPMRPIKQRYGAVDLPLVETCVEEILARLNMVHTVAYSEPFLRTCVEEVTARGIGWWHRKRHTQQAVHDGVLASFHVLSFEPRQLGAALAEGIMAAIQRLKDEAVFAAKS